MNLDTRFLTVHGRTALWFRQRENCEACDHLRRFGPARRCSAVEATNKARHPGADKAYCIDAREPGAACGPGAALFTPKGKP